MLADAHMHTEFSQDSHAKLEDMAEKAISIGIDTICITDHIDWDFPERDIVFDFNVGKYMRKIEAARKTYGSRLDIRMGVELGMQPHLAKSYEELLAEYPFDFVIGSVHLVNNRDPYYPEAFGNMTDGEVFGAYFENVLRNVKAFHGFDSLGHLDYIVRYGRNGAREYRYEDYADIIDEILRELIRQGKALEVNSAGLRKKLGFPNPHPHIIKRFCQLGGEMVTVGADAHKPAHVGGSFKEVAELLKSCGFSYYTRFRQRKPEFLRL